MNKMQAYNFELFADYFQFYIQDEQADGNLSESWTDEAVERLLALAPGIIGVGTARNMDVPVIVEVWNDEPVEDLTNWDQVTECSIDVPSGRIVVAGCTDYFPDAARIEIKPGSYRVRIFYGGLNTLSTDGLEGNDNYRIILWPAEPISPRVLKKYKNAGS